MAGHGPAEQVIGVISDTHGLLRPQAMEALRGVDLIVHAGDIGRLDILTQLGRIARVFAVRGNMDNGPWAERLPHSEVAEAEEIRCFIVHDLNHLDLDPADAGFHVVVTGHTHKAHVEERNGVLYLNPGSAGPRRFTLPTTVAKLRVRDGALKAEIIELET